MKIRESWVGDAEHLGILQRLGLAFFLLAFALLWVPALVSSHAQSIYWLFLLAHLLVYTGFTVAAIGDLLAGRKFSWRRLCYAGGVALCMLILCPVMMGAAAAAVVSR